MVKVQLKCNFCIMQKVFASSKGCKKQTKHACPEYWNEILSHMFSRKTYSESKQFFKQSDHFKEITKKHRMWIFVETWGEQLLLAKSTKNIQKPWKYNDAFSL